MKALITGITGFAGSHLAEHLLACGDEVLGSSASGEWGNEIPLTLRRNVPLVSWNLSDEPRDEIVQRMIDFAPDWVFHLAAVSIPEDCGHDEPTDYAKAINVTGTQGVMAVMRRMSNQPRLVFASTCLVYRPVTRESPIVSESSPLGPAAGYGKTKLAAEAAIQEEMRRGLLDAQIARLFPHAGPRQSPRLMLSEWAKQFAAANNQPVRVKTLNSFLDLSDVRDVSRAYRLLALHGRRGEVYNVGRGQAVRSGDVFATLQQLAAPQQPYVETKPGFQQERIADITKLTADTGWRPVVALEQTVRDTFEFWQERAAQE